MTGHADSGTTAPSSHSRPWSGRLAALAIRIPFDLLVADMAYETWHSASPVRGTIVIVAVAYALLSLWVLAQGGRIGGRGWLTDPQMPLVLILGCLVGVTWTPALASKGLTLLQQPMPVILASATVLVIVVAMYRLAGPPGVRTWWLRACAVALGGYAVLALATAVRSGTPYPALLHGDGPWHLLPIQLRGAWLGPFVLLPLAFLHEFSLSMARLTTRGIFRWMILFALGFWIAWNCF